MSANNQPTRLGFRTALAVGMAILAIAVPLGSIAQPAAAAAVIPGGGPRCFVWVGTDPGVYAFVYCDGGIIATP